jgi:hypothetical protein
MCSIPAAPWREGMGLAQGVELTVVEDVGGRTVVRIDVRGERAPPGIGDHRARRDLTVPAREHRVADAGQHGRTPDRVTPDQRVGPRTAGTSRHPPPRGVVPASIVRGATGEGNPHSAVR